MRVAAIDCGTNSIRLLIADAEHGDGAWVLTDVVRRMEVVRLGQGVDRTGELAPQALARTFAATQRYAKACREHGVEQVRFVATSATRDARNRDEFVTGVRDLLGVEPEVVPGSEEAALSFAGAVSVLGPDVPRPALVVDIGGGSTEVVVGQSAPEAALSMDIGCVRMTERHLADDPPTQAQVNAARADIEAALDLAERAVPLGEVATVVGVAGSVTTVTAHALRLDSYLPERIDGTELPLQTVLAACEDLLTMTRDQRAALGHMHPGRVDVIGAGALVWAQVLARVAARSGVQTVTTSEHDILDGIALSQLPTVPLTGRER